MILVALIQTYKRAIVSTFHKVRSAVMSQGKHKAAVAFFIAITALAAGRQVCIEQLSGNDTTCCIDEVTLECCKSLKYAIDLLKASSLTKRVHISVVGDVIISEVIKIANFTDFTIESENKSLLECDTTDRDSGLYFEEVSNLSLRNIVIQGCSMVTNSTTTQPNNASLLLSSLSAVYIINSNTVSLKDVNIQYNIGTGLVMYDTGGYVEITDSVFEGNRVLETSTYPGGSGLYIEFTCRLFDSTNQTMPCTNRMEASVYSITNTAFRNNSAFEHTPDWTRFFNYDRGSFQGFGRGGGLCIILNGNSSCNVINITDSNFTENSATTWGGGAYISPRQDLVNNNITIRNTNFINNYCTHGGGGGMQLSFLSYKGTSSSNQFLAIDCKFIGNTAKTTGGGLTMVSSRESRIDNLQKQLNNVIMFQNCLWKNNMAELGSAVDFSPGVWHVLGNGLLPVPEFENCIFEHNFIAQRTKRLSEGVKQETSGVGTLVISNFAVVFKGYMKFCHNHGSAIYLQSGIVTVGEDSELTITNNTAKRGGAIAFIAFSVMYLKQNTKILFRNNVAFIKGGAIYTKSVDQHEKLLSRSCFLQARERDIDVQERNVSIIFEGNHAETELGNTLYVTSLQSCNFTCNDSNISSLFGCVATITGLDNHTKQISTHVNYFQYDKTALNENLVIPGKYFKIPIMSYDELNQTSKIEYDLSLLKNNGLQLGDINSVYLTNQSIQVLGPNFTENDSLLLQREETSIYINISNTECPPGHYLINSNCQCFVAGYKGIWKCNRSAKIASIINGFWIGPCKNGTQCTGFCPNGFCTNNANIYLNTTIDNTAKYVCAKNREGKLCGRCTRNHSAYYHSTLNKCGEETLCSYGIPLYIISELVPLTVFFLIIIMSNISFTSGSATGFILYAQILYSLNISTNKLAKFPEVLQVFSDVHHFIYSTFNLNFFNLEVLSFCLWRGATTLDTLAWNYVTIVYTLLLILLTVWLLNRATCRKICVCWRHHTLKNAVIHGLTAFLVMCYSQCARVSFQLLNIAHLSGYKQNTVETVIHLSGEQTLFDHVHVTYGLIAVTFLCLIVILPPLFLVIYPLCLKFLALCHLSELQCVTRFANKIPMPLFDSFQSCFKDRYRFFSGLYFFYRVVPLLIYAVITDMVMFYVYVEIFLILILSVHAILQPYKKPKHNIIDSFIFGNLAIINAMSLLNYWTVIDSKDDFTHSKGEITVNTVIQQILIFLPLVCVGTYSIWLLSRCTKRKWKERRRSRLTLKQQHMLDSVYLPPLRNTSEGLATKIGGNFQYHELVPQ